MIKKVSSRIALLIVTAAIAPLIGYGLVSIGSLRAGTRESVLTGNLNLATQVAEQIRLYVNDNIRLLRAVGADLLHTNLQAWQQDRILKNYVLDFPEVRELTLLDAGGQPLVSSRVALGGVTLPPLDVIRSHRDVSIAPITVDDDLLPTTRVTIRLAQSDRTSGWLTGELSLEQLWRTVDRIRVGQRGFVLVVAQDGQLIAHGNPDEKWRIARGENLRDNPLVRQIAQQPGTAAVEQELVNTSGERVLAVAARIADLGWTVIVEQPTDEAFAVAEQLRGQLLITIGLALCFTALVSLFWGRSFLKPIYALQRGTRAIAGGHFDERVHVRSGGQEFCELGQDFNTMAERLVQLQADVRKQERQAMLGRLAAGLVHDLAHPIQNVSNNCKLILTHFDDAEYREIFKRTVDRELGKMKRFLDDLRQLGRPRPLRMFSVDLNRVVRDVLDSLGPEAQAAGIALVGDLSDEGLKVEADVFALDRVLQNLIVNAIQATAEAGRVQVSTLVRDGVARVEVADTGSGIPEARLGVIFEDFLTTKRQGLGLGLAVSRKLVEQMNGSITVTSELGKGSSFVMTFPLSTASPGVAAD